MNEIKNQIYSFKSDCNSENSRNVFMKVVISIIYYGNKANISFPASRASEAVGNAAACTLWENNIIFRQLSIFRANFVDCLFI